MTTRKQRHPRIRKERNEQTAKDYFLELCAAYYDDLQAVGNKAPHGQFLNNVEAVVLDQGQELIRQSFEIFTQDAIDDIEKKMSHVSVRNAKRRNGMLAPPPGETKPPSEP